MARSIALRRIVLISFLLLLTFILYLPIARTAGVVAICDEASLDTALAGGGAVTFACSGTINITTTKFITIDTTLDASGQSVILDGGDITQMSRVSAGVTFQVNNVTFTRGNGTIGFGGAINNQGTTIISNSTFSYNHAGGSSNSGALANSGTMTISNSTFIGNYTGSSGGGVIGNNGTLNITNSTFSGNSSNFGGVMYTGVGGNVTISNSTFSNNSANQGAAIYVSAGAVTIFASTFTDNVATVDGGAFYSLGALTSAGSTYVNSSCVGVVNDGGGNRQSNAPGCPGVEGEPPAPPQCQEMLDPTFAAPVGWYCQVLMRDNVWLGSAGAIPGELVSAGVIIAVEVSYYDFPGHAAQQSNGTHQVCLQGAGRFIFLSNAQSPRVIFEMNSVSEGGYTCAWVDTPGTAVLIRG